MFSRTSEELATSCLESLRNSEKKVSKYSVSIAPPASATCVLIKYTI